MDLSHIKMVVSDMDGTLLNSNHEVSDRFLTQFKELKKKGIHFVAASGRQYHSMADKLNEIRDDIIFIAENGALIKKQDEELSVVPIENEVVNQLIEISDEIDDAYVMLCGKYTSYFDQKSSKLLDQIVEYYSSYQTVSNFKEVSDEIIKVALFHNISAEKYLYHKIKHFENQAKVKVSGQYWLDINHSEAHKGNALQKVMQTYQIKPSELLVFGDYNNDLEMLALANYSFAMANAHPNVKKVANFMTESNDSFGVETILSKVLA